MALDNLGRTIILGVADNKLVKNFVRKYGMKLGAKRFIAGEYLEQTIAEVKRLNEEGFVVTLDHVGESVSTREETIEATDEAIMILDAIATNQLNSNLSIKLTQLGLVIDPELCYENVRRIVQQAKKYDNFVRIDIEDAAVVQITIELFKRVQAEFSNKHVGLALQAYLYRTEDDIRDLDSLGTNLRLIKGAYKEAKEIAFPHKKDVDRNFINIIKIHLLNGNYTAIATHHQLIVDEIKTFVEKNSIPYSLFEFQMLYGISNDLQRQLLKEGYTVRIYTPYGKEWFPYFSRRIAERPANAFFVLKGLFK
jgi:proline dehydrogenase